MKLAFALVTCAIAAYAADQGARFFDKHVAPILAKHCLACHNNELNDGGLSVEDRASLLKGGSRGPAVVPGNPAASLVIQAIRHEGDLKMPPGPRLSQKQIAILTEWVSRGMPWGTKLAKRYR